MTREVAIDRLRKISEKTPIRTNGDDLVAITMAIKALKQEPCDDAVSRDMALEKMADYVASGYADSAEDFEEYSKIICQLPPVTQKPIECEDAVSRQAMLDYLKANVDDFPDYHEAIEKVLQLPSVTQKSCEKCNYKIFTELYFHTDPEMKEGE